MNLKIILMITFLSSVAAAEEFCIVEAFSNQVKTYCSVEFKGLEEVSNIEVEIERNESRYPSEDYNRESLRIELESEAKKKSALLRVFKFLAGKKFKLVAQSQSVHPGSHHLSSYTFAHP